MNDNDELSDRFYLRLRRVGSKEYLTLNLREAVSKLKKEDNNQPGFNYNCYYQACVAKALTFASSKKKADLLNLLSTFEDMIDVFLKYLDSEWLSFNEEGLSEKEISFLDEAEKISMDIAEAMGSDDLYDVSFENMSKASQTLRDLFGGRLPDPFGNRCFALLIRNRKKYIALSGSTVDYIGPLGIIGWSLLKEFENLLHDINHDLFNGRAHECHLTCWAKRKKDNLVIESMDINLFQDFIESSLLARHYSCCERKIQYEANGPREDDRWFIRYFPCEECIPFLCNGCEIHSYQFELYYKVIEKYPDLLFFSRGSRGGGIVTRIIKRDRLLCDIMGCKLFGLW